MLATVTKKFEGKAGDQELCQAMGIQLDELSRLVMQLRGLSIGAFMTLQRTTMRVKQMRKLSSTIIRTVFPTDLTMPSGRNN
jgi:hypothetical protein